MLPFKHYKSIKKEHILNTLIEKVPLKREKIFVDGIWVEELRQTFWYSEKQQVLNYSGKKMQPSPFIPIIKDLRDLIFDKIGIMFDSVLVNYYENNNIGMRYHSDPLDGKWSTDFFILSFGDTRKLIFREINNIEKKYQFNLENGDAIHMFGNCQDVYQHCLKKEKGTKGPRMSLVFKKYIQ
jgi:alkylated DNA repair dioxygenase AlkB